MRCLFALLVVMGLMPLLSNSLKAQENTLALTGELGWYSADILFNKSHPVAGNLTVSNAINPAYGLSYLIKQVSGR